MKKIIGFDDVINDVESSFSKSSNDFIVNNFDNLLKLEVAIKQKNNNGFKKKFWEKILLISNSMNYELSEKTFFQYYYQAKRKLNISKTSRANLLISNKSEYIFAEKYFQKEEIKKNIHPNVAGSSPMNIAGGFESPSVAPPPVVIEKPVEVVREVIKYVEREVPVQAVVQVPVVPPVVKTAPPLVEKNAVVPGVVVEPIAKKVELPPVKTSTPVQPKEVKNISDNPLALPPFNLPNGMILKEGEKPKAILTSDNKLEKLITFEPLEEARIKISKFKKLDFFPNSMGYFLDIAGNEIPVEAVSFKHMYHWMINNLDEFDNLKVQLKEKINMILVENSDFVEIKNFKSKLRTKYSKSIFYGIEIYIYTYISMIAVEQHSDLYTDDRSDRATKREIFINIIERHLFNSNSKFTVSIIQEYLAPLYSSINAPKDCGRVFPFLIVDITVDNKLYR